MGRRIKETGQLELDLFDGVEMKRLREENEMLRAISQRLEIQNAELIDEISRLKWLVYSSAQNDAHTDMGSSAGIDFKDASEANAGTIFRSVTKQSHIEDKIALFRSYFRGREDVYAVRAANASGKAPYYPKRQFIGKENGKIQWGDYLPLTDEVFQAHLHDGNAPLTVGIYPLLTDETCWFLAIDFDKTNWKDDTAAFLKTCQAFNIPTALERSRSGNGGHVWIFFANPLPARTARRLGTRLLTRTMETRHQIGLDSYDRMFPNQDTSPKGKHLGNLIALPLQRVPAKEGHSLFIDEEHVPYPDQWVFLASLRKMTLAEVETVVSDLEQFGELIPVPEPPTNEEDDIPWKLQRNHLPQLLPEPLPKKIKIILADQLYVEKLGLSSPQVSTFIRMAAFQNPEFYKAQAMRMPTYNKPRVIDCSEELPQYIALPRGCQEEVISLLGSQDVPIEIEDRRNSGTPIDVAFHGQLRAEQQQAAHNLVQHDIGTLSATTAFGKTVVAAWMIAERATNTLILVDKTQLMEQWVERLSVFFNVPKNEIGIIGGGKQKRTGWIDIALFQSVYVNKEVKDFVGEYGHVVVDECHHVSAVSFEHVLKRVNAKYVLGLTATLVRKDGKHPIVLMQCGPVRFKTDARMQAKTRPFQQVVIPRHTDFKLPDSDEEIQIQPLYALLSQDEARNDMIFDDVLQALEKGRSPILLTDRIAHLEYFENRLKGFAKNIIVLRGGMGKNQREATQARILSIPADAERLILATGRFVGEGFDDARLDTLFLAMPISWKGTVQQYAGRLHRLYEPKQEVQIYDYVDRHVSVFARMYQKRLKGYQTMGYKERSIGEV